MKRIALGASALALAASAAHAGGIERTTQSALVLFEDGNHFELSFGKAMPDLSGTSYAVPLAGVPEQDIDNVADDYTLPSMALKLDINDRLAAAFIFDRPFGANIAYPDDGFPLENSVFGGTEAYARTDTLTALLKYQINDNFSVYGGLRSQKAEGNITLQGLAYGAPTTSPVNGYNVDLDSNRANGYVLGAAYERPDIALRVALTYNSAIEHKMSTTETLGPAGGGAVFTSDTEVKTPESWNLEAQTGVAPGTLVFGSVRWVAHSEFRVDPETFETLTGGGLIDLEDTVTYRLGVGRQFTDKFAGSMTVAYEAPGDELVSPLAPSTGFTSVGVGGAYDITDMVTLSGGVSYTWLGDAKPETGTPDQARADFEDNDAWGVGMKIAFKF